MRRRFELAFNLTRPAFSLGDALILLLLAALLYASVRLAVHAPAAVAGLDISLSPRALPYGRGRRTHRPGDCRRRLLLAAGGDSGADHHRRRDQPVVLAPAVQDCRRAIPDGVSR